MLTPRANPDTASVHATVPPHRPSPVHYGVHVDVRVSCPAPNAALATVAPRCSHGPHVSPPHSRLSLQVSVYRHPGAARSPASRGTGHGGVVPLALRVCVIIAAARLHIPHTHPTRVLNPTQRIPILPASRAPASPSLSHHLSPLWLSHAPADLPLAPHYRTCPGILAPSRCRPLPTR